MRIRFIAVSVLAGLASINVAGQEPTRRLGGLSPALESLAGVDTYDFYCVPCHGRSGSGDGPLAAALKTRVPDLTTLAARNGGTFPLDRVRAAVANTERPIVAHGTEDMPVWQTIFGVLETSRERADARIDGVARYIERLQRGTSVSEQGRSLFLTYCASCHGRDGRGGGPAAVALRREPPDLTRFALRNGGVFPAVQVARLIDGRDIPAHGSSEMPVWGDVFRRPARDANTALAEQRIAALTSFLEAIQQRNGE